MVALAGAHGGANWNAACRCAGPTWVPLALSSTNQTDNSVENALDAFAGFAPHYDRFSAAYRHDRWLGTLSGLAGAHGLPGRDVLDVACGTGKSITPLLARAFRVVGCDICPEMLDVARSLHVDVELFEADMRSLPDLGRFAWITCINDAINYLLGDDDLAAAFGSMGSLLVAGGLVCFDVTAAEAHHRIYEGTRVVEDADTYMCWQGRGSTDDGRVIGEGQVVIFSRVGEVWERVDTHHRQRLWSHDDIATAAASAGLEVVARYGQRPGCIIEPEIDDRHPKIVYFLRRPTQASGEGR